MNGTNTRRLVAVAVALVMLLGLAMTASAHEHREVGDYEFTVGFIGEPALVGEPNGLDLRVQLGHGDDGTPVEGLQDSLQAEIIYGGETKELEIRARFGQPGAYTADIIPTTEGAYSFRIFGTIEGTEIDETFTAGPNTFSEVGSTDDISFPSITAADEDSAENSAITDAKDAADSARTLAIVGIIAGVLGLAVGAAGVMMAMNARSSSGATARRAGD